MPIPKVGGKAPEFALPDQDGKAHKLSDYKGKWVLLYFYPKDDTPGCTIEACTIRDQFYGFQPRRPKRSGSRPKVSGKIKAVVLGVSKDSMESHRKFADAYNLPFALLSDEDKRVIKKYGVTSRISFLINPAGKIAKIYENVKPPKHAEEVLKDLSTLIKS